MEPMAPTTTPLTPATSITDLRDAVENCGSAEWLGRAMSWPIRHGWLDVEHVDRRNVPTDGPMLLAANHLSFIDSVLVMYSFDRPVSFLGKAEYLDNPITRWLLPATGMLPLDRTGRRARVTLKRVAKILDKGGAVGVHPEGTRSRDGLLGPGHPGVAQMALRSGAPVVPVALVGTDDAQPVGQRIPTFRAPVEVRFGAPIGVGRWAGNRRTSTARAELTEEIMASIASLSGQERRTEESHDRLPV